MNNIGVECFLLYSCFLHKPFLQSSLFFPRLFIAHVEHDDLFFPFLIELRDRFKSGRSKNEMDTRRKMGKKISEFGVVFDFIDRFIDHQR